MIQPCIIYSLRPPNSPVTSQKKHGHILKVNEMKHTLTLTTALQQQQLNLLACAGYDNSCKLFATSPQLLKQIFLYSTVNPLTLIQDYGHGSPQKVPLDKKAKCLKEIGRNIIKLNMSLSSFFLSKCVM